MTLSARSPGTFEVRLLTSVAIGALAFKIALALFTFGTNDSTTWDHNVAVLRSEGYAALYREGAQYAPEAGMAMSRQAFIHPPAVLHALRLLGALQDSTGLPPHVSLRIACAFADIITLTILWLMFPGAAYQPALIMLAIAPVSVLISGFHGNTDPIMMCLVVLSLWMLERGRSHGAGAVFGLALGLKLAPAILIPAVLISMAGSRERLRWVGAALLTWTVISMPWLVQSPELILRTIFGYSGSTGLWGFPFLTGLFRDLGYSAGYSFYAVFGKWLSLGAAIAVPLILRWDHRRLPLFAQCGLVSVSFLFLSPGFGLQYLVWTMPWLVILAPRLIARYLAVTGIFIAGAYAEASSMNDRRIYANLLLHDHRHFAMAMGLFCWIGMAIMARHYWRLRLSPTELHAVGPCPVPPAILSGPGNAESA